MYICTYYTYMYVNTEWPYSNIGTCTCITSSVKAAAGKLSHLLPFRFNICTDTEGDYDKGCLQTAIETHIHVHTKSWLYVVAYNSLGTSSLIFAHTSKVYSPPGHRCVDIRRSMCVCVCVCVHESQGIESECCYIR